MAITLPNASCPIHDITEQVRDIFANVDIPDGENISEETNLAAFTTLEAVLEKTLEALSRTTKRIVESVHEPIPLSLELSIARLTPKEAFEAGMHTGALGLNLNLGRELIEVQRRFRKGLTTNTIDHLEENGDGGDYIEDADKAEGVKIPEVPDVFGSGFATNNTPRTAAGAEFLAGYDRDLQPGNTAGTSKPSPQAAVAASQKTVRGKRS